MPTLSASDYTSFIKIQAAAQSYRNGAIPTKIQTSDQVVPTQSILNARLLASQASYVAASPATVKTVLPAITAVSSRIVTGASAAAGRVTYTTAQAHGLSIGDVITVSGFVAGAETWANLTSQTVISTNFTSTQFAFTNAATGTAITGSIVGRINGRVYYTTATPHMITASLANSTYTILGLTTAAFNLTAFTIPIVTSSTNFVVSNSADAVSITGQSGYFEQLTILVSRTVISGNARIRPFEGVGYVNQPKSLSAVTQSGTLSSGKFQQVGGLPLTAPKSSGVYAPMRQLARVDTKVTG
jgi:hypothetical protein